VKFGIFYEQQLPKPWHDGDEQRLFAEALDQVELADKLGFDHLWVAEHHFLPEYSHSSAPEMFLAAATQRTKRIRLGHGIIQATTNQAPRIAERIATLDVLSGGRAEFGLGEGQGMMELEPFGVSMDDKRERFCEMVEAVLPMLYNDSWSYNGKYVSFPERSVLPRPVQKPHPPLWVACTKVKTIRDAARWGFGALGFQFATPDRADVWVRAYYNEFLHRRAPLADYVPNPQIAVASYFMCAPTDEDARKGADGNTFFEWSLGQYSRKLMAPGNESLWERYQAWRQTDDGRVKGAAQKGLIGSPASLGDTLEAMQRSHIDQVILLMQAGRTTHENTCASLELFAREVMPQFQAAEDDHQRWKREVLDGRIVLDDPSDDDLAVDAEMIPGPKQLAARP
jgi:alkanesulfonate monooxygenase SsuD/methylene tetrahydromethanopterin reductase-like flavin-dependent oxidoreductase (luciferase family)